MGLVARPLLLSILALSSALAYAVAPGQESAERRPLLLRVRPSYPELARRMHVSGNVVLAVEVRPNGSVGDAHVESGHALLRQAAEEAVRRWRFAPGPATTISITIAFESPDN
ncbi:MAG: energy transducer TonB [Acidobacteriota bacterium]|nr:energy transducer TonB [Acidobacteriota bacterium]